MTEKEDQVARYLGPKAKLSRREGTDLFLKSARRSIADKSKFDTKPGQHGRTSGQRTSDYGLQLREKQKVKRMYGVLEKQFRNYYTEASRLAGKTGENLLVLLETRLDNVIYRAGFAKSRDMARQIVRHGHILVNGRKVDIPSFHVSQFDIIDVRTKSQDLTPFIVASAEFGEKSVPAWLEVVPSSMRIIVHGQPTRAIIDTQVQEQLIVELYSK